MTHMIEHMNIIWLFCLLKTHKRNKNTIHFSYILSIFHVVFISSYFSILLFFEQMWHMSRYFKN